MENVTNFCINAEIVVSSQPTQTQRCCSVKVGRIDFLVRILILECGDRFPSFIHLDISGFILRSQDGKQRRCDELYPPESRLEQREWPPMIIVVMLRRGHVATLLLRRGTRAGTWSIWLRPLVRWCTNRLECHLRAWRATTAPLHDMIHPSQPWTECCIRSNE